MDIVAINRIFDEIHAERERQNALKAAGKFKCTAADLEATNDEKVVMLGEEFGEVCRAVHDGHTPEELREELIQVAAIAVAWVQAVDAAKRETDAQELKDRLDSDHEA